MVNFGRFLIIDAMQRIFLILILWLGFVRFISIAGAESRPPIKAVDLERQIHQQVNRIRQNYGLAELDNDEQLAAIARHHSRDMANRHFFNHINLQGESPSDRAIRRGWHNKKQIGPETLAYGVAENIFLASLYDKQFTTLQNGIPVKKEYAWKNPNQVVQTVVQGWMNSPPHRKLILSTQYDRQGIGIAISGNEVYVTENLF